MVLARRRMFTLWGERVRFRETGAPAWMWNAQSGLKMTGRNLLSRLLAAGEKYDVSIS
jgi:hypothetical protein